jgi:hypothetical protein
MTAAYRIAENIARLICAMCLGLVCGGIAFFLLGALATLVPGRHSVRLIQFCTSGAVNFIAAFIFVLSASLVLPGRLRVFGTSGLLVLGLILHAYFFRAFVSSDHEFPDVSMTICALLGGTTAILLHARRREVRP